MLEGRDRRKKKEKVKRIGEGKKKEESENSEDGGMRLTREAQGDQTGRRLVVRDELVNYKKVREGQVRRMRHWIGCEWRHSKRKVQNRSCATTPRAERSIQYKEYNTWGSNHNTIGQ